MSVKLSPIWSGTQFFNAAGTVLSGGKIYQYTAGTTTLTATYTDSTGATPNANPIILDSAGRYSAQIWFTAGTNYKLVLTDSTGTTLLTEDNLTGVNDVSSLSTPSEWINSGITPTYVSATSFTLPGNQTSNFQVGRRVQLVINSGTLYGSILTSVFTSVTTITVSLDSGSIDSTLSVANYALLGSINPSVPARTSFTASFTGSLGQTTGSTILFPDLTTIPDFQNGSSYSATTGTFTVPYTGVYLVSTEITVIGSISTDVFQVMRNGASVGAALLADNAVPTRRAGTYIMKLNATDTINVQITSGGPFVLGTKYIGNSDPTTKFSVAMLY